MTSCRTVTAESCGTAAIRHAAFAFFLGAIFTSAAIWALSLSFADYAEPWEADGPVLDSRVIGFSGAMVPKTLCAHDAGAVFGQFVYELLLLEVGPLLLLNIIFPLGYSLVFLVAAVCFRNKLFPQEVMP